MNDLATDDENIHRGIVRPHKCVHERCFMSLRYACCLQQPTFGRHFRRQRRKHSRVGPHHPKFFRLHRHGKNIFCLGKNERRLGK